MPLQLHMVAMRSTHCLDSAVLRPDEQGGCRFVVAASIWEFWVLPTKAGVQAHLFSTTGVFEDAPKSIGPPVP